MSTFRGRSTAASAAAVSLAVAVAVGCGERGGVAVSGRVTDAATGASVPGADIRVSDSTSGSQNRSESLQTDADGRFRSSGRWSRGIVTVKKRGYAPRRAPIGGAFENVTLALEPETRLSGRVLAEELGSPIASVVLVQQFGDRGVGGARTRTAEAPRGSFEFSELTPGWVYVLARASGRASKGLRIRVSAGQPARIDIPLSKAASLTGVVVDDRQRPLAGAVVRVRYARPDDPIVLQDGSSGETVCDSAGSFTLHGVRPLEPFTLTARARSRETSLRIASLRPGQDAGGILIRVR